MAQIPPGLLLADAQKKLSVYTMKGCDQLIVRRKGGPSRQRIKTDLRYENTRLNNAEFGGRATASKWIRQMLFPVRFIADYNITGPINALLQPIQELDGVSDFGQRSVALSANPRLLEGFNLNRRTPFDTIVQNPVHYTLSKKKLYATVDLPTIMPGLNFDPGNFQLYQFIASLGVVPDLFYTPHGYTPKGKYDSILAEPAYTEWYPAQSGSPAIRLELQLPDKLPNQAYSVVLAIGIAFGTTRNGYEEPVKYVGGAKVLATA